MSIQGKVDELNSIRNEINSLRIRGSNLRKRAKLLEDEISIYLESKDQPGLKYKGTAIIREVVTKRQHKKKKDAYNDCIDVLENYGIHNASKVLEEVMEAKRGPGLEQNKLKFKKYTKKNEY
jgi:hypothetical protein